MVEESSIYDNESIESMTSLAYYQRDGGEGDDQNESRYIRATEKLRKDLQEITTRELQLYNFIMLDHQSQFYHFHEDQLNFVVFHNDALLPEWRSFANALSGCNENDIDFMHISEIQLDKKVLDLLAPAIESKNITALRFDCNEFGRHGILFLGEFIRGNSSLQRLELTHNRMIDLEDEEQNSDEAAIRFFQAVSKHPKLERIKLAYCRVGTSLSVLSACINASKDMTYLDLKGNCIGPDGASIISEFLATNPCMKRIKLTSNELDDTSAVKLAEALRTNNHLTQMDLGNNDIMREGKQALIDAIFNTTDLNSVADSNHTCYIVLFERMEFFQREIAFLNGSFNPQMSRWHKIFFALSITTDKILNMGYIDDAPLECMPKVLQMLQKTTPYNSGESLDMVFEVLKNWRMPWLFMNGDTSVLPHSTSVY